MKKIISIILVFMMIVSSTLNSVHANTEVGVLGESESNPILISSMEQLIEELEKDVDASTYYKLTKDISLETSIDHYTIGGEWKSSQSAYDTIRKPSYSQCVVGTGKKFLELDGHNIHYKNNANFIANTCETNGYDSLTFFYLGKNCNLTVSNKSKNLGRIWYDGWMNNRTNFFGGPNYIVTAVRDVFRVETGAELVVNNVDIKAGRNRKIWMVNAFNIDKDGETNSTIKLTFNGNAYEQIYGSAIVVNGGKVTINGGYLEGRGRYRDKFNVSGVPSYQCDQIDDNFLGDGISTENMVKNCLTHSNSKAAVQIAKEGSVVIINGGEFWGCGGASVVAPYSLDGGTIKNYKLRINAGTFDTSATDKERLPDRCVGTPNSGPWPFSRLNYSLWANCRTIRSTPRGYIGIPAVDGYGDNVFDIDSTHVYIDEEDEGSECFENSELDFTRKSDSDTIIVKPRTEEDYNFTETQTRENYRGDLLGEIYAYANNIDISQMLDMGSYYTTGIYYEPNVTQVAYFSVESQYDLSDLDNPYFKYASSNSCVWTLYTENQNGETLSTSKQITLPIKIEHVNHHTVYNYGINLNSFKDVVWNKDYRYYLVPKVCEVFGDRYTSYKTYSYPSGALSDDHKLQVHNGLTIIYDPDYCSSFASSQAIVTYSNAAYNCDPILTFDENYNKLKGNKVFQWQVLDGDTWVDYKGSCNSKNAAIDLLNKHDSLANKYVRLKITSSDGTYSDALYSNVCMVQPDINTEMPKSVIYSWKEDPNHEGKYILEGSVSVDTMEYLLYPCDATVSREDLDWENASKIPIFDNLEMGYYEVVKRYKATENYTSGSEIVRQKVVVGPYVLTENFEVTYNGEPAETTVVQVGKEFCLHSAPLPEDASNSDVVNQTAWSPQSGIGDIISARWFDYYPFDKDYQGRNLWLIANQTGTVEVSAIVTLDNGKNVIKKVKIIIVPDDYVPYTVSILNNGVNVVEGGTFIPQVRLHAKDVSMLDGLTGRDFKAMMEGQMQASKLMWTLLDGNVTVVERDIFTNGKANIHSKTGKITLTDKAKVGDVIRYAGYLENPYLGIIETIGYFKVESAPEEEVHVHDYSNVVANDDRTHYLCCECGEKISVEHKYASYVIEEATETKDALYGYICDCEHSYEAYVEGTRLPHEHTYIYNYDLNQHWQICDSDDCSDTEDGILKEAHDYILKGESDTGQKVYACSVCNAVKLDDYLAVGITSQPKDVAAFKDKTAKVTFQALGDGLTYTWYYKNKGATTFTKTNSFTENYYSVKMNEERNGRQVYCVVEDAYGNTIQSDTVTLHMAVAITTQPKTTYTQMGSSAKVSVKASGDGLTYTWYLKNAGSSKFSKSSTTTASYSVKMSSTTKNRMVYCVVKDKYGKSIKTDVITLKEATSITTQPKTTYVQMGSTAKVSVKASGDELTYAWYIKNEGASKYTKSSKKTSTYSVKMSETTKNRLVYCIVKDKYGNEVKSKSVVLREKVSIIKQPSSVSVATGEKATVKVSASGDGLTYAWYIKNANSSKYSKSSTTTATYSVKMSTSNDGRQVYCVVTDKYGYSVKTKAVTLTIK